MRQSFNCQFTNCLEKYNFFANDFKHRHIIYYWKVFFTTSMNSTSLPQNEAPFGSDSLAKFVAFARKSTSTIWTGSSWTKGTIVTRRSRETYWDQEMMVKVARGWRINAIPPRLVHTPPPQPTAASHVARSYHPPRSAPSEQFLMACAHRRAASDLDREMFVCRGVRNKSRERGRGRDRKL